MSSIKELNNLNLSQQEYQKLLDAYKKLGEVLISSKQKKVSTSLKSLYGLWKGLRVEEKDFKEAEQSLFKKYL